MLVVSCADALAPTCNLIQDVLSNIGGDAKFSHARSRAMPEVVQTKVVDAVLPNYVAHAMR